MITCNILPNGNLKITAGNEARAEIADRLERYGFWNTFAEIFESYSCNGSYTPFNAEDGNPFVGLTSAPCIAEAMRYPDSGDLEIEGRFWYFGDYMTRDPLDELKRKGRVEFQLAA